MFLPLRCAVSGVVFLFLGMRAFLQARELPPEPKAEMEEPGGSGGLLNLGRFSADTGLKPKVETAAVSGFSAQLAASESLPKQKQASSSEIIEFAQRLAGGWPAELPRDALDKIDFQKLLSKLKEYQKIAHPGSGGAVFPEYRIVSGTVGRVGHPVEDFKIATTAAHIQGKGKVSLLDERAVQFAWEVIQYYAGMRLAKFLFFLPRASRSSIGAKVIALEDWYIDVHKGVENVLFEIYNELSEGAVFTDVGTSDRNAAVTAVCFLSDQAFAIGTSYGTIEVRSIQTKELLASLEGHSDRIQCILSARKGERILSCDSRNRLRFWDLTKNKRIAYFDYSKHEPVFEMRGWFRLDLPAGLKPA